ncbi:RNA recognition motif domain-containing protein [Nannocystis pusilla]
MDDVRLIPRRELVIAYVTFADEASAHGARRALDGSTFAGHRLRVEFAI